MFTGRFDLVYLGKRKERLEKEISQTRRRLEIKEAQLNKTKWELVSQMYHIDLMVNKELSLTSK